MTTYVALLRGINVGGNNRVAMPELRGVVESLGYGDVVTYINSGNVVFDAADEQDMDDATHARVIEAAVRKELGVTCAVLVRSASELAEVIDANPFGHEKDPKKLHAVFLPAPWGDATYVDVQTARDRAAEKGSRDEVELVGRVAYLWTPDGFGRSVLAPLLARSATKDGTARNWATVTKLLELSAR
ncbi:MAG TPA: DUF1697 domain-containing protein [Actinomycetales bacterium]|nr:DUF1697 domain-containing protein [Actinomycetales bacterium]